MNSKIYINDGLIELRNFISSKKIPEKENKKKNILNIVEKSSNLINKKRVKEWKH